MYVIKRNDGLFLCDGRPISGHHLPQPIWQPLDGTRFPYIAKLGDITKRVNKLSKIYTKRQLEVVALSEEESQLILFRKLRG